MLSLRDPEGFLFERDGRIYRYVARSAADRIHAFLQTEACRKLVDQKRLVSTAPLTLDPAPEMAVAKRTYAAGGEVFEHGRVTFPSYPFEWHPAMLAAAADATLEIAQTIAADGYTLKDATPFNVLFTGARPMLVDLPSIAPLPDGYPYWLAEAQYIRTFALPLMAHARANLTPKQIFLSSRQGLEPNALASPVRLRDLFSLPQWLYATLPALATRRRAPVALANAYRGQTTIASDRARFIYLNTLGRHRALLRRIKQRQPRASGWVDYTDERSHYDAEMLRTKCSVLARALEACRPARVLDIGANTGEFSELACSHGCSVVAIDSDLDTVGALYARTRDRHLDILPLHMDFANPSPGSGWLGRETLSFAERAQGYFDCVMMLAVIHHLVIADGLPLASVIEEAARLTRRMLIIEYVPPTDPMSQVLIRGRDHLGAELTQQRFEAVVATHFAIDHREVIASGGRALYVCRRSA